MSLSGGDGRRGEDPAGPVLGGLSRDSGRDADGLQFLRSEGEGEFLPTPLVGGEAGPAASAVLGARVGVGDVVHIGYISLPETTSPGWRERLVKGLKGMLPEGLPPRFAHDAEEMCRQAVSRLVSAATRNGALPVRGRVGRVAVEWVPVRLIECRGERRYGSGALEDALRAGQNLVPVVCGLRPDGTRYLLDGNHRLRAYTAVGLPVLSLTFSVGAP